MHVNNTLILPDEIITNILKYADYKTVIACRRVGATSFSCGVSCVKCIASHAAVSTRWWKPPRRSDIL
jgi:hypothetical protein